MRSTCRMVFLAIGLGLASRSIYGQAGDKTPSMRSLNVGHLLISLDRASEERGQVMKAFGLRDRNRANRFLKQYVDSVENFNEGAKKLALEEESESFNDQLLDRIESQVTAI